MKTLDLSFRGNLSEEYSKIINKKASELVDHFHHFTDNLSKENQSDFYWWISNVSSRDTAATPIFFYYVAFHVVNDLNKNDNINKIITDSPIFIKLLKTLLKNKNLKIDIELNYKRNIFIEYIKNYYSIFKVYFFFISRFLYCKISKNFTKNKLNFKNKQITLIETNIVESVYKIDRDYGNIYEKLDNIDQKKIFFAPNIISNNISKSIKIINYVRSHKKNYLIKDDFLNLYNYLEFYKFLKKRKKFLIKEINILDIDFSPLLKEQIILDNRYFIIFESILTYNFIKNLHSKKINIKCSVDWFENQIIDRAWNLAFNKFYTKTIKKGYRGLIPANLFLSQMYVTEQERISMVLPEQVIVIGKSFVDETSKYLNKKIVTYGPALRFNHLFDNTNIKKLNKKKNIFVLLPSFFPLALNILKLIVEIAKEEFQHSDIHFYIKNHPLINIDLLKNKVNLNDVNNITFTQSIFSEIIYKSNVTISSFSSTCLESLASKVPAIIIQNFTGIEFISIPKEINNDVWKLSYNKKDLVRYINLYINITENQKSLNDKIFEEIKKNYFEDINISQVKKLFEIN